MDYEAEREVIKWLKAGEDIKDRAIRKLSGEVIEYYNTHNEFKENKPYTLYRGLGWDEEDVSVDYIVSLTNNNIAVFDRSTSWSTEYHTDFKYAGFGSNYFIGVILKIKTPSDNILLDCTKLGHYPESRRHESESILKPGEYKYEIDKILHKVNPNGYKLVDKIMNLTTNKMQHIDKKTFVNRGFEGPFVLRPSRKERPKGW